MAKYPSIGALIDQARRRGDHNEVERLKKIQNRRGPKLRRLEAEPQRKPGIKSADRMLYDQPVNRQAAKELKRWK